jgi:NAD(P)H-hydrate epimerase
MSLYPSHRPVSVAEAQAADREATERCGLPALVLMEHAGRGLAEIAMEEARGGAVLVLCGPGNNGGDGYAAARFLRGAGVAVRVLRVGPAPGSPAARLERTLWLAEGAEAAIAAADDPRLESALSDASLLVDAVFGIGLTRPLEEPYLSVLRLVDARAPRRVAADVPSGLDADTGEPFPVAVRADVTAAMGFVKRGCLTSPGRALCGRLVEVDVGLPPSIHRRFRAP